MMETCIYKGIVTHRRFKPKRHFFSYKTFSIFFDLDELKDLQNKISIFSFNKFNIFSFYNKDHGDRDGVVDQNRSHIGDTRPTYAYAFWNPLR